MQLRLKIFLVYLFDFFFRKVDYWSRSSWSCICRINHRYHHCLHKLEKRISILQKKILKKRNKRKKKLKKNEKKRSQYHQ